MEEIWKDVIGWEDFYMVSNMGAVKSKSRKWVGGSNGSFYKPEMYLKPFRTKTGYLMVDLRKKGCRKSIPVHRLVAIHFIPNPLNKCTVNHKYGDKSDNRASQLEWATQKENVIHSYKTGLKVNYKAAQHYRSIPIIAIGKNSDKTISFPNARVASLFIGVSISTIWKCLHGLRNNQHYKFEYLNAS